MLQNLKIFKWWYIKGVSSYKELLEKAETGETELITAMTEDEKIFHEENVSLGKDGTGLVVVNVDGTKYHLTPNQQVTDDTEHIKNFWLVQNKCCWKTSAISGIFIAVESNKAVMLPSGVELFGVPTERYTSFTSAPIKALVPIGEEKYIAWEDKSNKCYIANSRETDDVVIKTALQRTARLAVN